MTNTASLWNPGSTPNLNADSSIKTQRFIATADQEVFTLTAFSYVVGIGSLLIFKNGELQAPGVSAIESTSTTFTLSPKATLNDEIVAVGFVGLTGSVTLTDTDLILANHATLRAYVGALTIQYCRGTVIDLDGGQGFFFKDVGQPPATYVDNGDTIILPAGGDGSEAWLRETDTEALVRLGIEPIDQAEAEARAATTNRIFTAERVGQAIVVGITAIVTGSFIKTLYEAIANTNAYTDVEKTNVADAVSFGSNLVGAVIAFTTAAVPTGWLQCNGGAVSRTTYLNLFNLIGITYGNGDGSSTFNLPDLRGKFIRGYDNAAGNDPDAGARTDRGDGITGDSVGTQQVDELKAHVHSINSRSNNNGGNDFLEDADSSEIVRSMATDSTGGNETRPINVYLMYCIKT